jgi:DNA-binding NtrC family response regulator
MRRSITVSKQILLVTSEAQSSTQRALAGLGALRISSDRESTDAVMESSCDLVVVDDLPSSVDLVIRFHDRYPKLPIVVLSSDQSWEQAREAWRAGATDVVSKQPDEAELSQAVRRILGLTEKSILMVDDDPTYLTAWSRMLRDEGFSVATASTRKAALEAIADRSFGLAIVDLRLEHPDDIDDMSGIEVADAASRKGIASIILTGHPNFDVVRSAMRQKADGRTAAIDLVYKAEGLTALRNRIEKAFARLGGS